VHVERAGKARAQLLRLRVGAPRNHRPLLLHQLQDRGFAAGETRAQGHIRWGKAIKGLTGKLGEFTARHVGPAPKRGHVILIEAEGGALARGYATSTGEPLAPEIIVSNKTNIRREMAAALRAFGGATRLMNACG
jgi:hypothetical protein